MGRAEEHARALEGGAVGGGEEGEGGVIDENRLKGLKNVNERFLGFLLLRPSPCQRKKYSSPGRGYFGLRGGPETRRAKSSPPSA